MSTNCDPARAGHARRDDAGPVAFTTADVVTPGTYLEHRAAPARVATA